MFLQLPIHCKTTSLLQKKNVTELLHNRVTSDKNIRGIFFSTNINYSYFSKDLMIRSSETVEIVDIRALFKLFPDTNFNTEIQDMSRKFQTYGNTNLDKVHDDGRWNRFLSNTRN